MDIIEQAIIFAAKAHKDQTRKSTDIPYIIHPFGVGMLLQKAKCTDEVIAAGILHDTLEDTCTTYEELTEQFGAHIANLVRAASEHDKSLPWEERKQHTIDKLKDAQLEEIQVITADKLHNLKSIRADLAADGERTWGRFNRGKHAQHWYYASIVNELASRKKEFPLIYELEKEVKETFGSLTILTDLDKVDEQMETNIQEKIRDIFNSVEICSEYSSESIKIKDFYWNGNLDNFIVEYSINQTRYIFHHNNQIASEINSIYLKNCPLDQLEFELNYIKRMYERGIGSKEYYPFTNIK